MKTALLSVWKENSIRTRYPLVAGVLFVLVLSVLAAWRENGSIYAFLSR
jgi:hypothetical protein